MQKLNKEQRNIVQYHRHWCKSVVQALKENKPAPKAYRAFVSGPGGVGKSHVIEILKHDTIHLLRYLPSVQPQDILCLLTAPTGTAAFNISSMTIHSTFLIPVAMRQYRSLGADTLNTLRNKLNNVKVVIIDEISMVGANLFYQIHRRLEEIKGCRSNASDSTFGDVTMIAVGDLYQLPPVAKAYVFEHPNDSYAKLQDPLWYQFKLAELNQIMRQKDDAEFAQLLNRVRTATCTKNDHLLLKSREINPEMKNYPMDVLHVFSTHKLVNKHNQQMLDKINERIYTIQAIDSKKDKNSGINIEFPEKSSETGGLETQLKVAVGCRVMLTYNIDVSDGLSNVLCLCETFLQTKDKLNGSIIGRNDMEIFRIDRTSSILSENKSGSGGVLLAAQKELSPAYVASNISKHLEYIAVQLKHNSNKLLIISLYRPPSGKVNRFLQEIDQVLSDTNAQNSDCIIVGDFNEDLLSTSCPILTYFQSKKFHQKTDAPTRDSGSLLDHTYTSENLNVNSLSIHDAYYSDHDFVSFSIS